MTHYLMVALASFVFIFLKSWQQRNVAFNHLKWIVPTSLAMALTEVYVIAIIATNGFGLPLVLAMGFGGGTGSLLATIIHNRYLKHE